VTNLPFSLVDTTTALGRYWLECKYILLGDILIDRTHLVNILELIWPPLFPSHRTTFLYDSTPGSPLQVKLLLVTHHSKLLLVTDLLNLALATSF